MENEYFRDTFVALDLEMNQPSKKIIQIGAVIGTYKENDPIETFSVIINPQEDIEPRITELTGITQEQVDTEGVSLEVGYEKLLQFVEGREAFINPITWGGGDSIELKEQLMQYCPEFRNDVIDWPFGRRWIDTKTLYVAYRIANGQQPTGGLAKAMTHLKLKFIGRKHDAKDDAYNTLIMFRKMLQFFNI